MPASAPGFDDSFALVVPAAADPTTACFLIGSHPRTRDLLDLLRRRDPGAELEEVLSEHQLQRVLRAEVATGRRLGGRDGPPKVELAVGDEDLEADLARASAQELPVGHVRL